jgi:hypothetical protein
MWWFDAGAFDEGGVDIVKHSSRNEMPFHRSSIMS